MNIPNDKGYYPPYYPNQQSQALSDEQAFPYTNNNQQMNEMIELQLIQKNKQNQQFQQYGSSEKYEGGTHQALNNERNLQYQNEFEQKQDPQTSNNEMITLQNQHYYNQEVEYAPNVYYQPPVIGDNGFLKLLNLQGVYIKQKFDALENVTGCEKPNEYKIYPADGNGNKISNNYIFKCKEKSGWCSRNFLPGSSRPFSMVVKNKNGNISSSGQNVRDSEFLFLKRPYKCTFLCLERPKLEVIVMENGINKLLGYIREPFSFIKVQIDITDLRGNVLFHIIGESFCMPAIWCKEVPCRSCQEGVFIITDKNGQHLSHLIKKTTGCLKQCASDASNFGVVFPTNSNPEEKALIIAAVLFLDYRFFEESQVDKNHNNSHVNYYEISNSQLTISLPGARQQ